MALVHVACTLPAPAALYGSSRFVSALQVPDNLKPGAAISVRNHAEYLPDVASLVRDGVQALVHAGELLAAGRAFDKDVGRIGQQRGNPLEIRVSRLQAETDVLNRDRTTREQAQRGRIAPIDGHHGLRPHLAQGIGERVDGLSKDDGGSL